MSETIYFGFGLILGVLLTNIVSIIRRINKHEERK